MVLPSACRSKSVKASGPFAIFHSQVYTVVAEKGELRAFATPCLTDWPRQAISPAEARTMPWSVSTADWSLPQALFFAYNEPAQVISDALLHLRAAVPTHCGKCFTTTFCSLLKSSPHWPCSENVENKCPQRKRRALTTLLYIATFATNVKTGIYVHNTTQQNRIDHTVADSQPMCKTGISLCIWCNLNLCVWPSLCADNLSNSVHVE